MKTDVRKIFSFGRYSLALLLPKKWLSELSVEAGDYLQLEFDRKKQRITVKRSDRPTTNQSNSHKPQKTSTAKGSKGNPDAAGSWEPIPQL